ncbi:hypothetical protein JCM24511_08306 [Saitozyma sp. JCM 24511]|nr:hypothetical protein JCM24511_08306 [Saitozyma sp. JCM 24511]
MPDPSKDAGPAEGKLPETVAGPSKDESKDKAGAKKLPQLGALEDDDEFEVGLAWGDHPVEMLGTAAIGAKVVKPDEDAGALTSFASPNHPYHSSHTPIRLNSTSRITSYHPPSIRSRIALTTPPKLFRLLPISAISPTPHSLLIGIPADPLPAEQSGNVVDALKAADGPGDHLWEDNWDDDDIEDDFTKQLRTAINERAGADDAMKE